MDTRFKKVMLAHAFFLKNDQKQLQEKFKPYPPIATLYAASLLRSRGYQVTLFDAMLSQCIEEFQQQLELFKPDALLICEDSFNFLSKMCLAHVRQTTQQMVTFARQFDLSIIINSADASDAPDTYLAFGANYIIQGEIESGLASLLSWLEQPLTQTRLLPPGIISADTDNKNLRGLKSKKTLRDLDSLPMPAWDLVDFQLYRQAWSERHGYFGLNLVTTRGCPYRCNWCAKPIWGQQYVCHSPEYIVTQLAYLQHSAQPDHIWFADDIFGLRKGWIEEFSSLLKQKGIRIPYTIQSRADLITDDIVTALAESGCNEVWLGVESGSQKILNEMNKDLKLASVIQARNLLKNTGIKTGFFIQLGYPGEDIFELNATRELITALLPDEIGVSVSYPLPGTEFFEKIQAQLSEKKHWLESNDLDIVFNATFSASFYRQVRNHLHQELAALLDSPKQHVRALWDERWAQLMITAEQHRQEIQIELQEVQYGG